jgi:L-threonylcarbamoyladenylate synthase
MVFDVGRALALVPGLGPRTERAARHLLPGPVTLVLPNPERAFPLACGPVPERLGLRVPRLEGRLSSLELVGTPLLQSSANLAGGADPRTLDEVDPAVRAGADLELDGGELPGIPSTVIDLGSYEADGRHEVLREGALSGDEVASLLGS